MRIAALLMFLTALFVCLPSVLASSLVLLAAAEYLRTHPMPLWLSIWFGVSLSGLIILGTVGAAILDEENAHRG